MPRQTINRLAKTMGNGQTPNVPHERKGKQKLPDYIRTRQTDILNTQKTITPSTNTRVLLSWQRVQPRPILQHTSLQPKGTTVYIPKQPSSADDDEEENYLTHWCKQKQTYTAQLETITKYQTSSKISSNHQKENKTTQKQTENTRNDSTRRRPLRETLMPPEITMSQTEWHQRRYWRINTAPAWSFSPKPRQSGAESQRKTIQTSGQSESERPRDDQVQTSVQSESERPKDHQVQTSVQSESEQTRNDQDKSRSNMSCANPRTTQNQNTKERRMKTKTKIQRNQKPTTTGDEHPMFPIQQVKDQLQTDIENQIDFIPLSTTITLKRRRKFALYPDGFVMKWH